MTVLADPARFSYEARIRKSPIVKVNVPDGQTSYPDAAYLGVDSLASGLYGRAI
jgi:hypothetical protein